MEGGCSRWRGCLCRWRHGYKFPVPSEVGAVRGTSPSASWCWGDQALGSAFCCLHGEMQHLLFGAWMGKGNTLIFAAWFPGLFCRNALLQPKGSAEPVLPKFRWVSVRGEPPARVSAVRDLSGAGFQRGGLSLSRHVSNLKPPPYTTSFFSPLSRCDDHAFVSFPPAQKKGRRI